MLTAGPSPAFLMPMVVKGGKKQENGKPEYMGCLRSRWGESLPQQSGTAQSFSDFCIMRAECLQTNSREMRFLCVFICCFAAVHLFPFGRLHMNLSLANLTQEGSALLQATSLLNDRTSMT